jgi:UDP-N-acetylglucosamine 3-dehydrogenase
MTVSAPLRAALIGCGNIGARGHAPAYAQIAAVELAAVCDVDETAARRVAAATGAEACLDYRRLLDRPDIHLVDICTPTDTHAAIALAALAAGKHVLCEKPLAPTLAEAQAMINAAHHHGRRLMVGYVRRFDPRYRAIKEAIAAGEIGRPLYIRRADRQRLPFPAESWFWHPERGGGVILDIGIHQADLFRWYFEAEPIAVYAIGRQVRDVARRAGSYDHAFLTFRFPDNRVGLGEAAWSYPPGFEPYFAALDVVGSRGKIHYDDGDAAPMFIVDEEGRAYHPRYFRFMATLEQAFVEEIRHFAQCILDDRAPLIGDDDALAAQAMAVAAQLSAQRGEPVRLPLTEERP